MAQSFSKPLYNSKAWEDARIGYAKSVGWLCEDCMAKGITTPGHEVHHMIPLTPANIENPEISLAWSNLRLLCHDCHMARHEEERAHRKGHRPKRYRVDPNTGRILPI